MRFQLTSTECGAACLAMVASFYGRHTLLSECRDLLGLGRDGVSARRLAEAAGAFGLQACVDRTDDPFASPLDGPAIAYYTKHHFVVLERIGRRFVRVTNPAGGRELLTRDEFRERYGGVLIRFAPAPGFQPRRARWRDALLGRYLREFVATPGSRRLLAGIVTAAALLQVLGLAMPFATQFVVDRVIPQTRDDLLPLLLAGAIGTAALYGLLTLLRSRLLLALRGRADRLLTQRYVDHLLRLPLPFFLQRSRGDLLMRLGSVSSTREQLTQQVLTLLLDAALLSGYVVGLAVWAPQYVPIVLGLGFAQAAVLLGLFRRIKVLARQELQAKAEEQSYLVEVLEAVAPVKANGIERHAKARWRDLFDTYREAMLRRGRASSWVEAAQGGLSTMAPLTLLWFGLTLVLRGEMSLGTMLAANSLAMSVLAPLQTFVGAIQMFSILRAQVERIYDVLDSPPEERGLVVLPPRAPAWVEASKLAFRYERTGPAILSDVSFSLPPGAKLGVVGRTGSGKSTLALLLLGLLKPSDGRISHNGVPIGLLDLPELRRGCGVVLQQLTLFNGSIEDNLTLGRTDFDRAEIEEAALTAGLHDDVLALPMGYDTIVGEGGAALSAGQRQRVALARALLHRPRLLILDEATSHLDPGTERHVDEALSRLQVSRIVISHRLSAIRNADQILVLDGGRVISRGRHDQLIQEGGMYKDLFGPASLGLSTHQALDQGPVPQAAPNGRTRAPGHRLLEPNLGVPESP
jgi:ABC-type bacteriocin/lantibiotic exporter with double-glycine peptidase domain